MLWINEKERQTEGSVTKDEPCSENFKLMTSILASFNCPLDTA